MSFKQLIAYKAVSFLFVDPSVNNLGWSVYTAQDVKNKLVKKLIDSGVYTPPDSGSDSQLYERCRSQFRFVAGINKEHSPNRIYIEVPPQTMYEGKKMSFDLLIARAQNVAKLFAVSYSLFAHLADSATCLPVLPAQWQLKKGTGKEWSLHYANCVLKQNEKTRTLSTKRDENEADAISMGDVILTKLYNSIGNVK